MTKENNRAKIIKEILKKDKYYKGIHLQELYTLIENHPQYEEYFGSANINNPKQYKNSTRALLQHRAPGMKHYKGKHGDFMQVARGIWTYNGNVEYAVLAKEREEIIEKTNAIIKDPNLNDKERKAFVKVRMNQGIFRENLINEFKNQGIGSPIENINDEKVLIASHIMDYNECESEYERADYNNGLILSPNVDKLFDRKYITFDETNGELIILKEDQDTLNKLAISGQERIPGVFLTKDRKYYLKKRNESLDYIKTA